MIFPLQFDRWTNDAMLFIVVRASKNKYQFKLKCSLQRLYVCVAYIIHSHMCMRHIYKTAQNICCLFLSLARSLALCVTHTSYQYNWIPDRIDQWSKRRRRKKKVTSIALAWVCQWILSNHFYRFDVSSAWRIRFFFHLSSSISIW